MHENTVYGLLIVHTRQSKGIIMTILLLITLALAALCLVAMAASVLFMVLPESGSDDTNMLRSMRLLVMALISATICLVLTVVEGFILAPPLAKLQFNAWTVSIFAIISMVVAGPMRPRAYVLGGALYMAAVVTAVVHKTFF